MRSRHALPLVSGVLGASLGALLLRRGIVMGPDSWAYWEGSVSLIEKGEYAYLGGARITAFPPLFAAALAMVQAVLGVSMRSVAIAVIALAGLASFLWTSLYVSVKAEPAAAPADVLAVTAIAGTLAVSAQTLLSESLWLAILPALLWLLLATTRRRGELAACAVVLAALLLTRNATVALLPGAALLLWRRFPDWPWPRRLAGIAAVVGGAFVPWLAVRAWLGQLDAHAPGRGAHGVLAYAWQALAGLAAGLGPERWGIGAALLIGTAGGLAWMAARPAPERTRGLALAAFAVLGLGGHVALFALTYVAEPLRGRFAVFAVLALAVALLALAGRRRVLLGLGAMLAVVALYRVAVKARLAGLEQPTVALDVRISSDYPSGPARPVAGGVLVAPPTYPWIPHR